MSAVDGHTGVVVGLNSASTPAATRASFESTFGTSESSIVSALQGVYSGDYSTLLASINTLNSFANANLDKLPIGLAGGSLLAFSDGVPVGTVNAAPVPEPATLAALGLGAAALLRRRRKA